MRHPGKHFWIASKPVDDPRGLAETKHGIVFQTGFALRIVEAGLEDTPEARLNLLTSMDLPMPPSP